jgi:hypothetical protein
MFLIPIKSAAEKEAASAPLSVLRRSGGSEIGGKKIPNDYLSIDCPA